MTNKRRYLLQQKKENGTYEDVMSADHLLYIRDHFLDHENRRLLDCKKIALSSKLAVRKIQTGKEMVWKDIEIEIKQSDFDDRLEFDVANGLYRFQKDYSKLVNWNPKYKNEARRKARRSKWVCAGTVAQVIATYISLGYKNLWKRTGRHLTLYHLSDQKEFFSYRGDDDFHVEGYVTEKDNLYEIEDGISYLVGTME